MQGVSVKQQIFRDVIENPDDPDNMGGGWV